MEFLCGVALIVSAGTGAWAVYVYRVLKDVLTNIDFYQLDVTKLNARLLKLSYRVSRLDGGRVDDDVFPYDPDPNRGSE